MSRRSNIKKYNSIIYPKCGNIGCNDDVQVVRYNKKGVPKTRYCCQHCHKAEMGQHSYRPGVILVKKPCCDNLACLNKGVALPSKRLHVDHIDGNSANNDISNLQTLCDECHIEKSKANNDYAKKGDQHTRWRTTYDKFFGPN